MSKINKSLYWDSKEKKIKYCVTLINSDDSRKRFPCETQEERDKLFDKICRDRLNEK